MLKILKFLVASSEHVVFDILSRRILVVSKVICA